MRHMDTQDKDRISYFLCLIQFSLRVVHAYVKKQPNLTVGMFCQWVNDDLLRNETLDYILDFVFSILLLF